MRKVADRLDLEPAMLMGRVVASTPATGGPGASGERRPRRHRDRAPAARDSRRRAARRPAPAELTSRERRERALLAMCIALPEPGAGYLERLGERHLSRSGQAAAEFIRAHPKDPAEHLPRENGALAALITELVMMAREEPASEESMELNFLLLDQRRLEDEIAAAGERGDYERRARSAASAPPWSNGSPTPNGSRADPVNCPSGPTGRRRSGVAQSAEHSTVNRRVVGSSPTPGAFQLVLKETPNNVAALLAKARTTPLGRMISTAPSLDTTVGWRISVAGMKQVGRAKAFAPSYRRSRSRRGDLPRTSL